MKRPKNLLLTFDYELFLGSKSGSVEKCLIDPTRKILNLLDEFSAKAIFFVDTTYLNSLKIKADEFSAARKDYELIELQLKEILSKGHELFPHIHPHWLDSVYDANANEWDLSDTSRYRFSQVKEEEREQIFRNSLSVLNEMASTGKSKPLMDGFRAGGWSIIPFSDFSPHFRKFGIRYDFSVLKGIAETSDSRQFNFKSFPEEDIFPFSENISIKDEKGEFTEICISTIRKIPVLEFVNRLLAKVLWIFFDYRSFFDGIGVAEGETDSTTSREPASVELITLAKLPLYINCLYKKDLLHFVSHPKMITPHNLFAFRLFLKWANFAFRLETDFRKMVKH